MGAPIIGEVRLLAGAQVPVGWYPCDGRRLPSFANQELSAVLGTTFGGDNDTFALPDLRGRIPIHVSPERALGQNGGLERVTLGTAEMPAHSHPLRANRGDGDRSQPQGHVWARSEALAFNAAAPDASLHAQALATSPAAASHENMMPFLGIQAVISAGDSFPDPDIPPPVPSFYRAEIRMMAFAFAPAGWALTDGQVVQGDPSDTLTHLLGTTFGGDGLANLAYPDLRGRVPIHRGPDRLMGRAGGTARHSLTTGELPGHTHTAHAASVPGDDPSPANRTWGVQSAAQSYAASPDADLRVDGVAPTGGGQAHENMPPFLGMTFCMGVAGTDPSPDQPDTTVEPFVGEIRIFAFDFVPVDWARCDGQFLRKDQNEALFQVIGTTYGEDGDTFALPNLLGRAPVGVGQGPGLTARALGESGGAAKVTLDANHLPAHTHEVKARAMEGGSASPEGHIFGAAQARALSAGYSSQTPSVTMSPEAVGSIGGGQPHENMPPYLPLNFCISLTGIMPG